MCPTKTFVGENDCASSSARKLLARNAEGLARFDGLVCLREGGRGLSGSSCSKETGAAESNAVAAGEKISWKQIESNSPVRTMKLPCDRDLKALTRSVIQISLNCVNTITVTAPKRSKAMSQTNVLANIRAPRSASWRGRKVQFGSDRRIDGSHVHTCSHRNCPPAAMRNIVVAIAHGDAILRALRPESSKDDGSSETASSE